MMIIIMIMIERCTHCPSSFHRARLDEISVFLHSKGARIRALSSGDAFAAAAEAECRPACSRSSAKSGASAPASGSRRRGTSANKKTLLVYKIFVAILSNFDPILLGFSQM